jgi:hypothetical protein
MLCGYSSTAAYSLHSAHRIVPEAAALGRWRPMTAGKDALLYRFFGVWALL